MELAGQDGPEDDAGDHAELEEDELQVGHVGDAGLGEHPEPPALERRAEASSPRTRTGAEPSRIRPACGC